MTVWPWENSMFTLFVWYGFCVGPSCTKRLLDRLHEQNGTFILS